MTAMGLTSNGIECVRAYRLPSGIRTGGNYFGAPKCVLVKWQSSLPAKSYQVYVNGQYAGATNDSGQRRMIVGTPTFLSSAVQISVFAVEASEADKDLSSEFAELKVGNGRIRIGLLRSQDLPIDAVVNVYSDKSLGEIDYSETLSHRPVEVWPCCWDKMGFGMSMFGDGDFGFDSASAVGFGRGSLGNGQFGIDADTIEWISPVLTDGVYKIAVTITDPTGNQSTAGQAGEIATISGARPASNLGASSFDKVTSQLVLNIF